VTMRVVLAACVLVGLSTALPSSSLVQAVKSNSAVENEIEKLLEEAISSLIDQLLPSTINITEAHNITKSVNVPIIGDVSVDLASSTAEVQGLKYANTSFGNFTDTGVNVTLLFNSTTVSANATGEICMDHKCDHGSWPLLMKSTLTLETEVTYKLKTVWGIPVGLDGTPCFGPVLTASLGKATISGFGELDPIVSDVVNDGIKDQHLFEEPLLDGLDDLLSKAEPKCNITGNHTTHIL